MNREVFREKLIEHCKKCYLDISEDNRLVYIALNNCYDIFNFPSNSEYFEYKIDKDFYPVKPLVKCFDWSETSLFLCMDIANYWAERNKRRLVKLKLNKIQEDF